MDEYMVGDVVSVVFHGSDTEGEILKIYPSGAVLLAPLYYDEEFGRECIVVEPQDIEYIIESQDAQLATLDTVLSMLMERIMPLEYWCLAVLAIGIILGIIRHIILMIM